MIDVSISWDRLEQNAESREISFESFTFQVAHLLYSTFGDFEYDYNAPGSEFYLHLTRDCPELKASAGQIVGWQAKFWLKKRAPDSTSLTKNRRELLIEAFRTSKDYRRELATWIICTPGQLLNTRPHRPKDALLAGLAEVDARVSVLFWNKPVYEAFLHHNYELLSPLFWHYFGEHFLGRATCVRRTEATLNSLSERFDIELYVRGSGDDEIWKLIRLDRSLGSLNARITELRHSLSKVEHRAEFAGQGSVHSQQQAAALEELRALSTSLATDLLVYDDRLDTIAQADSLASLYRARWPDIVEAYRRVQENTPDEISPLWSDWPLDRLIEGLVAVIEELKSIFQNDIHVLASAGYGKTCLACHIAAKCLEEDIPAVLLTGRLLSDSTPIASQIVTRLGLPSNWTLATVFACLDNLGFLQRKKIPLIIDGLNETVPNSARWRVELNELTSLARQFPHVLIVTTVRSAYCERIFGVDKPEQVRSAIILSGFTGFKVDYAVRRYFEKYRIVATNWSVSHKIFAHPLLLKMFCVVNEGSSVEISHASVFAAIEEYVEHLTRTAASTAGDIDRFILPVLTRRIGDLARYLWDSGSRSVDYSTMLPRILDPGWDGSADWRQTISCKLLDEGLLLSREIREGEEVAEFSHDLVAGVVVAKSVFFLTDHPQIDMLATEEVRQRLGDGEESGAHPLAEDILRALVYLWPKYSGGTQLIEVFDHRDCIKLSFEMLDVICATDAGVAAVREKVLQLPRPSDELRLFSEGVIDSVVDHGCLRALPILSGLILELAAPEVDLVWSEAIRARRSVVSTWLERFDPETVPADSTAPVLDFLAMLCSSTFDVIRDRALLALVQLGTLEPGVLLDAISRFASISDLYVLEHLIAALCGVALRCLGAEELSRISGLLRNDFVPTLASSHLWILDYIDTIFAYTSHMTASEVDPSWLTELPVVAWQLDEYANTDCTEERAERGYGPIDYDFARTYLHYLTHDSQYTTISSKKDITCKMIYRMKEHGYDPVWFSDLDRRIADESANERYYYRRHSQSYCRKMCRITFHELCGQMLLDGTLTPELGRFRLLYGDVDPTAPRRPPRRQLFTRCCVAYDTEPMVEWVEKPEAAPYLDNLKFLTSDELGENSVWVLVYGELRQSGRARSALYVQWYTQLCPKEHEHICIERLCSGEEYPQIPQWGKLMAGEIPWRLGVHLDNGRDHGEAGDLCLQDIVGLYNWEARREVAANPAPVPFLDQRIALASQLRFDPVEMMYLTQSGCSATRLIWDNTSMFLYAREDLLRRYCDANDYVLVWHEHSFKYGIRAGGDEFSDGLRTDFYYAGAFDV